MRAACQEQRRAAGEDGGPGPIPKTARSAPPLTVASSCKTLCRMVSDFEAARAELLAAAGALGELLRRYGEHHWAEWVIRDRQRIQDGDAYGIEHLLSAYGGMGSLNDVVIDPRNGHRIAEQDLSAANERLRQLSSRTYTAAMLLKVELRRSLCICRGTSAPEHAPVKARTLSAHPHASPSERSTPPDGPKPRADQRGEGGSVPSRRMRAYSQRE
jgi:hypothetical protein